MKFSALSIKNQQFNRVLRGYDTDEVKHFLERLADEVEALNTENENLKKELDKVNSRINDYRKIEKNLQDTLLKAHESSSKSIESARKQSVLILKEAELKAVQITEKAKKNADDIRNAVLTLREEKNVIIARLKALINSQAGLLQIQTEDNTITEPKEIKRVDSGTQLDISVDEIVEKLL